METPEKFLKDKYWNKEEFRQATEQSAKRSLQRQGEKIAAQPQELIRNHLKRFSSILERQDPEERQHGLEALTRLLWRTEIIQPEYITDSSIKNILFGNFAEQQGYDRGQLQNPDINQYLQDQFEANSGQSLDNYQIPDNTRQEVIQNTINDQKYRLQTWLDYLTSPEAENIPAAYRYWAFSEMLKMGSYDPERSVYNKRTKFTTANFPELDQQALALTVDLVRKNRQAQAAELPQLDPNNQAEFQNYLKAENFSKLYALIQKNLSQLRSPEAELNTVEGEWRHFEQGSSAEPLVDSLAGFHTQWCIAGQGTAEQYLSHSDLYIYYSQDQDGAYRIPRACIVNSADRGITEIRGIVSDQNSKQHLDDYITPIVEEKLKTIPGGETTQETMQDMRQLASIHLKHLAQAPLDKSDLEFIYEIHKKIQTTGYNQDPRHKQIIESRDQKADLSEVLGISPNRISLSREEALLPNMLYHHGYLDLSGLTSAEGLTLPQSIGGYLDLRRLTSVEGLTLPQSIGDALYLDSLTSAEGLTLPQSIGGDLNLRRLTSVEGLTLPQSIGGYLNLRRLTSVEGLTLPQSIGGYLDLSSLTSAEGLTLPQSIGGYLDLSGLTSAEGLTLPQSIGGYLDLSGLTSAEGLTLPQSIGDALYLDSLTSAEGLTLPQSIGDALYLYSLTSAEGLTLPQSIGDALYLDSLTSAEGLTLPQSIGGDLDLRHLTSVEGLTLPQSIGGYLNLRRLTSVEGLTLPQSIGGYLDLSSLTSVEGLTLPQSIGGYLDLSGLTSAEGLTLPQSIGGYLDLSGLTSAEGLTLPQSIGGYLDLSSLTSAEGLTLPQSIGGYLDLSSLTSAEGLTLPQSIGGYLNLRRLTSVEGLTLPQSIGGYLDLSSLSSAEIAKIPTQAVKGTIYTGFIPIQS